MNDSSNEGTVRRFFHDVESASLLLPDGWFGGRPMENSHRLTFVAERPKRLIIELDDHLLLSIVGSYSMCRTFSDLALRGGTPTLIISGFDQAVLEFVEYVSETPHLESFADGEISFVAG